MRILLAASLLISTLSSAQMAAFAAPDKQAPKPPIKKAERPSETDQRTTTKPGKPESEQPPPEVVGKELPKSK